MQQVNYNISILQEGRPVEGSASMNQMPGRQKYVFDEPGQYVIRIEDSRGIEGSVDIPISVIPEFPLAIFAMVLSFAIVIATTIRARHLNPYWARR